MSYSVGMQGPGETIEWAIPAPPGVDLTTVIAKVLRAQFSFANGRTLVVEGADWSLSNVTATSMRAIYVPAEGDFPAAGPMRIRATLTLDGVVYRLKDQKKTVEEGP